MRWPILFRTPGCADNRPVRFSLDRAFPLAGQLTRLADP